MKNYKCLEIPAKWVSAHRKNEYKVRLPQSLIASGSNSGGFLKLTLSGAFAYPINVGDRIYIPNLAPYTGFHIIKSITSSIEFTLETPFASVLGGSIPVWQVRLPTVKLYKGYQVGELIITWDGGSLDLYDIMPYTLVGEFAPEAAFSGYLEFDICGYLKTVIETPYKGAYSPDETSYLYPVSVFGITLGYYTPKYYNKVDLVLDGTLIRTHYAANAAITTDELNQNFVDTQRAISPLEQPVKLFDSYSIGDYIDGNFLTAKISN